MIKKVDDVDVIAKIVSDELEGKITLREAFQEVVEYSNKMALDLRFHEEA